MKLYLVSWIRNNLCRNSVCVLWKTILFYSQNLNAASFKRIYEGYFHGKKRIYLFLFYDFQCSWFKNAGNWTSPRFIAIKKLANHRKIFWFYLQTLQSIDRLFTLPVLLDCDFEIKYSLDVCDYGFDKDVCVVWSLLS